MTMNQVAYWTYKESQRANKAKEAENERSNRARENETYRSNTANEYLDRLRIDETNRHNRATEWQAVRDEQIKRDIADAQIGLSGAQTNKTRAETWRTNVGIVRDVINTIPIVGGLFS